MRIMMQCAGRVERIFSHKFFEPKDIEVVTHGEAERYAIHRHTGIPMDNIHACYPPGFPDRHGFMRDFIEKLVGEGNWYIGIDDNIEAFYEPPFSDTRESVEEDPAYRQLFMTPMKQERILPCLHELKARCEEHGTVYGGFGYIDNYYFRRSKWHYRQYVKSKVFVGKVDGVSWRHDPKLGIMLDHARTFDVLCRYGKIVNNRWIFPYHQRFSPGGLGSLAERMPFRLMSCRFFEEKYPGLIECFPGESGELDSPRIMKRSDRTFEEWRREHGYLH